MIKCVLVIVVFGMVLISYGSSSSNRNDEERYDRTVEFFRYTCYVRVSNEKVGPDPNIFSDNGSNG